MANTNIFPTLDSTLNLLIKLKKYKIIGLQKTYSDLLTERSQLLNTINLNVTPYVNIPKNSVAQVLRGGLSVGDWSTNFDVSPFTDNYQNTGNVMFSFLSSRRKKAAIIESIINIEKYKVSYQVEKVVLDELKRLWYLVVEIEIAENEIGIRQEIDRRIDSTGRYLNDYVKEGVINRKNIDIYRILFIENRLQVNILKKRINLLNNRLQVSFQIENDLMNYILEESQKIFLILKMIPSITVGEQKFFVLDEKIDSLDAEKIEIRKKYDMQAEYDLKIGPIITSPGTLKGTTGGAGVQFTLSLINERHNLNLSTDRIFNNNPSSVPGTGSVSDYYSESESDDYANKVEQEITNIMEELKNGVYYSFPLLNDLYSRLINVRIAASNLQYEYIVNQINRIQTLEEIGLRDIITDYISKLQ
jgi:hypothetical protein